MSILLRIVAVFYFVLAISIMIAKLPGGDANQYLILGWLFMILAKLEDKKTALRNAKEIDKMPLITDFTTREISKLQEIKQLKARIAKLEAENARITDAYKLLIAKLNTVEQDEINISP